jgi:hypothetical protein
LSYLNATRELALVLELNGAEINNAVKESYGILFDLKSNRGGIATLVKESFSSYPIKQKLNTRSSTEAELVSASDFVSKGCKF